MLRERHQRRPARNAEAGDEKSQTRRETRGGTIGEIHRVRLRAVRLNGGKAADASACVGTFGLDDHRARFRERLDVRRRCVVLDDHARDVVDRRDAMRGARAEFVRGAQYGNAAAAREQRAFETGIREFERAHAVLRRDGARAQKTAVDIHVRDAGERRGIDAAAHHRVHRAAHHDERDVGAPQQRGGDIDGIGGDGEIVVFGQRVGEREVRAAAVEKQQFAAFDLRDGGARERGLAFARGVHARGHGRGRGRDGQRAAVDAAAAPFGGERAQVAADRVFGYAEFGSECNGHDGLAGGEAAGDQFAAGKRDIIGHAR
ncbi:hypothetical protein PT2222_20177 [Paraburkholderia tropica]